MLHHCANRGILLRVINLFSLLEGTKGLVARTAFWKTMKMAVPHRSRDHRHGGIAAAKHYCLFALVLIGSRERERGQG